MKVGDRFDNFAAFKNAVHEYGKSTNAVYTVADSKAHKYVKMGCKHFGKRRTASKGIRPNQSSYKLQCTAYIYAKQFDGCVVITQLDHEHTHALDPVKVQHYPENRRLDAAQKEKVEELLTYGIKPAILQEKVRALTGLAINTQDLANLRFAMRDKNRQGGSKMEEALAELAKLLTEDPGATVLIGKRLPDKTLEVINLREKLTDHDEDNEEDNEDVNLQENEENNEGRGLVEFIFFQTGDMRKNFQDYPEVLLLDSTYNTTDNKMPLTISMVMDGNGSGRAVSYCFVANETTNTLTAVLKCLVVANPDACEAVKCIVVDKDLSEIGAVREIFGRDVSVQICTFHSLKAFKEGTKDIVDKECKEAVRKILMKLVYSESEEEYMNHYKDLENIAPEDFMENYFNKYWHNVTVAWTKYQKIITVNFGNFTNNRLENLNGKLKQLLSVHLSLAESVKGILLIHRNKEFHVGYREFLCSSKVRYVAGNTDPDVEAMVRLCTPFAANLMRSELQMVDLDHTTIAENGECTCPFFRTYELPCRHIFYERKEEGVPKFDPEQIANRWLISSQVSEVPSVENVVLDLPCARAAFTQKEKFKEAHALTNQIDNLLASSDALVFQERMAFLQDLYISWAQNIDVSLNKGNSLRNQTDQNQSDNADDRTGSGDGDGVVCHCGEFVAKRTVSNGSRKGRQYYCCPRKENRCTFEKDTEGSLPYTVLEQNQTKAGPMGKLAASLELPVSIRGRGRPKAARKMTVIGTTRDTLLQQKGNQENGEKVVCECNLEATERIVIRESVNKGRRFLCCVKDRKNRCSFFQWVETTDPEPEATDGNGEPDLDSSKSLRDLCVGLALPVLNMEGGNVPSDVLIVNPDELIEDSSLPIMSHSDNIECSDSSSLSDEDNEPHKVGDLSVPLQNKKCFGCDKAAVVKIARTPGNFGRRFYTCSNPVTAKCKWMNWMDKLIKKRAIAPSLTFEPVQKTPKQLQTPAISDQAQVSNGPICSCGNLCVMNVKRGKSYYSCASLRCSTSVSVRSKFSLTIDTCFQTRLLSISQVTPTVLLRTPTVLLRTIQTF